MTSSTRYTLKSPSGRRLKIRKGEIYETKNDLGFKISFQEQPARLGGRVHTHVWIECENRPELIPELYLYVTWDYERYPQKTTMFALLRGWFLNDDDTFFEGPENIYELVIDRKLSQTHIDHIHDWLIIVLHGLTMTMGMAGLFGEDEVE